MDFAILVDRRVKIKISEKRDKSLDKKKLWNRRVMLIPLVGDMLGMLPKRLGKGAGRVEYLRINQNHLDYNSVEISQSPEKMCYHSDSSERPSANAGVKNFQEAK